MRGRFWLGLARGVAGLNGRRRCSADVDGKDLNGSSGHAALTDSAEFGAGKLALKSRFSEPAAGVPQHPAINGHRGLEI